MGKRGQKGGIHLINPIVKEAKIVKARDYWIFLVA